VEISKPPVGIPAIIGQFPNKFIYLFSQFNCPRLDSIQHGPKGAPLLLGQLGSIPQQIGSQPKPN
jgi:hypothetical protein